jgi:uncharacterized protein YkwD
MSRHAGAAWWLSLVLGCTRSGGPAENPGAGAGAPRAGGTDDTTAHGEPYAFQADTRSPQPAAEAGDDFARACPRRDAALERAARFLAERELAGRAALDAEDIALVLRAEGAPYVWPHAWSLSGGRAGESASERFATWLAAMPRVGEGRCGGALVKGPEREVAVAIAVDVLADLEPLPMHTSAGTWLEVTARLRVPATEAKVLVLGPRGRPHAVPSTLEQQLVRARFRADRAGPWLVQVLATVAGGPRPVAEARVFAGDAPKTLSGASPAPGEQAATNADPGDALFAMVNGARESEGLGLLRRDPRLERVARAHAEAMRAERRLAHDVTDGSPSDRVQNAGIAARAVGENVARAADPKHAHRTLWQSPSHRSNLLERGFNACGIGVASDADGSIWVCELFASLEPAGSP